MTKKYKGKGTWFGTKLDKIMGQETGQERTNNETILGLKRGKKMTWKWKLLGQMVGQVMGH